MDLRLRRKSCVRVQASAVAEEACPALYPRARTACKGRVVLLARVRWIRAILPVPRPLEVMPRCERPRVGRYGSRLPPGPERRVSKTGMERREDPAAEGIPNRPTPIDGSKGSGAVAAEVVVFFGKRKITSPEDTTVGTLLGLAGYTPASDYALEERKGEDGPIVRTFTDPNEKLDLKDGEHFTAKFTGTIQPSKSNAR